MRKLAVLTTVALAFAILTVRAPLAQEASPKRTQLAATLVERGERALNNGQLTQPDYDNAFDHFTAALLLDPTSDAAKAGLDSILLAYIGQIERKLKAGQLSSAESLLMRALQYYPKQPKLLQLRQALDSAYQAQPSLRSPLVAEDGVVILPLRELDERGEALRKRLRAVAQRIRETDASVLIYARTDAEGRYLYSLLKSAVPGYLVRGDIRIHSRPRLQLEEPL